MEDNTIGHSSPNTQPGVLQSQLNSTQSAAGGLQHPNDSDQQNIACGTPQPGAVPDKYPYFPEELKVLNQWCPAGPDKAPYMAGQRGLYHASPVNGPWYDFNTANTIARQYNLPNIGLIISPPYISIDLDIKDANSRDKNGNPYPMEQWTTPEQLKFYEDLVSACDSYAEISVSGKGIHILVRGELSNEYHGEGVEIYPRNKFMVVTGNVASKIKYNTNNGVIGVELIERYIRPIAENKSVIDMVLNRLTKTNNHSKEAPQVQTSMESHSMSTLATAQYYCTRGWSPVPVHFKSKAPIGNGWQNQRITAETVDQYFSGYQVNIGILTGEVSSNLTDIDLDCPEALGLANSILPYTDSIFGRESTPRSHWLYICPGIKTKKYSDPLATLDKSTLVEIRSDGVQTVFPPSIHPSGEILTWVRYNDLQSVTPEKLWASVAVLAAACLLVRHWPQGSFHNACLPLAGGLLRAGWTEDIVVAFIIPIAKACGQNDLNDRKAAIHSTAERYSRGENITGWPSLKDYINAQIVDKVMEWLGIKAEQPDESFNVISAASWEGKEVEQRQWLLPDWIPMSQTTALYGDGGVGKTLVAQDLQTCVTTGLPWFGLPVKQGAVIGIYCEDSEDELHRRQDAINQKYRITYDQLEKSFVSSRVGNDNLLMTYDGKDTGSLTKFWEQIEQKVAEIRPVLLIVDTAADTFGGNENIRSQVRQFIQQALTKIAVTYNCAVLLCAHPSLAGLIAGTGTGGSTAWSNSVRSRLYLEREESAIFTTLTRKKSNYSAAGEEIEIIWNDGAFIEKVNSELLQIETGQLDLCRQEFRRLIILSNEQSRPVSASKYGNYAPREFVKRSKERFSVKNYEKVMEELFNEELIILEGKPGRGKRIVLKDFKDVKTDLEEDTKKPTVTRKKPSKKKKSTSSKTATTTKKTTK